MRTIGELEGRKMSRQMGECWRVPIWNARLGVRSCVARAHAVKHARRSSGRGQLLVARQTQVTGPQPVAKITTISQLHKSSQFYSEWRAILCYFAG
jgi:hypothetical protein